MRLQQVFVELEIIYFGIALQHDSLQVFFDNGPHVPCVLLPDVRQLIFLIFVGECLGKLVDVDPLEYLSAAWPGET